MTRLDIGKMNKDYVDAEHLEKCRSRRADGPLRSVSLSLDMIQDVLNHRDLSKVKSLLRANELPVDHEARGRLWMLLCSGNISVDATDDETFCMYATKFASVASERILPIHDMTDEIRVHHMLSAEGVKACHRVLYVISETHPQILQFSPLLYAFTSVMLHYMTEQSCFHCICDLLKRKDINHFLAPTELSLNAASFVLRDLAFRYAKSPALSIERSCLDGDFVSFCNDWVLWIFKHLPFHYLVRIVDCYLVEGYKVLFRVALVLIKLFHRISGRTSSFIDSGKPDAAMKAMCSDIEAYVTCDKLLKEAFGIRGFSKKEIDNLFSKTELALRGGALVSVRSPRPSEAETINTNRQNKKPITLVDKRKKLLGNRSQKSFKLDKDIHTQLVLEDVDSEILDKHQQYKVWSWLPPAEAVKDSVVVFTTNEHGYSLKTFYEKVEKMGPTLLIIKTMKNEIFGAYCSTDWIERHKYFDTGAQISYFGTGQSFVFSINPELVYNWVGKDRPVTPQSCSMFQAGDRSMLMIGGGNGCALQIDKDLDYGSTSHCDTFDNPPLVEGREFRIQSLEAFAFH